MGEVMQPTMKLRWVQRGWKNVNKSTSEYTSYDSEPNYVLQQWWEGTSIADQEKGIPFGEWRYIPIEVE